MILAEMKGKMTQLSSGEGQALAQWSTMGATWPGLEKQLLTTPAVRLHGSTASFLKPSWYPPNIHACLDPGFSTSTAAPY